MKQFVIGLAVGAMGLAVLQQASPDAADIAPQEPVAGAQSAAGGCGPCPADLNGSGAVDVQDLLILLGAWGACPDCVSDGHCDDGNPCTINQCIGGQCVTTMAPAGQVCNDGDPCTISYCDGAGTCISILIPGCCEGDGDCGPNQMCSGNSCVCLPGYMDCDGNPGNGCEINIESDPANCGGCGIQCPVGTTCVNGECVAMSTWYQDLDGDGWGDCDNFIVAPNPSPPFTASVCGDCDDNDPNVNPGAPEICDDGIDNDCNGVIDDCDKPAAPPRS